MLCQVLRYVCAVLAVAVVVLWFMLNGAANDRAALREQAAIDAALREQARATAVRTLEEAETLKRRREAAEKEADLLREQIEVIQRTRPRYNARPNPTDAAGHRASILRAVRQ